MDNTGRYLLIAACGISTLLDFVGVGIGFAVMTAANNAPGYIFSAGLAFFFVAFALSAKWLWSASHRLCVCLRWFVLPAICIQAAAFFLAATAQVISQIPFSKWGQVTPLDFFKGSLLQNAIVVISTVVFTACPFVLSFLSDPSEDEPQAIPAQQQPPPILPTPPRANIHSSV